MPSYIRGNDNFDTANILGKVKHGKMLQQVEWLELLILIQQASQ